MRINTNMNALTALNSATKTTALAGNSMEKLSSGLRINKAGDDAAGLAISEKMRAQIRGMEQAERNTQDGISLVQTAEGAMEEIGNIAQRMRELSVQSANETNTIEDRSKITEELSQLHKEIDRIAQSTEFNGKSILNGTETIGKQTVVDITATTAGANFEIKGINVGTGTTAASIKLSTTNGGSIGSKVVVTVGSTEYTLDNIVTGDNTGKLNAGDYILKDTNGNTITLTIKESMSSVVASATEIATVKDVNKDIAGKKIDLQVGANTSTSQKLSVNVQNISTTSLGLNSDTITEMASEGAKGTSAAKTMIANLDKALEKINTGRANLGAMQNRLETTSSNLTTSTENLTAAESRIRDVDVADEMMNLSKLNLINQAAQAMMVQAKSQPEGVMQLLR